MKISDFSIGMVFSSNDCWWQCTDIGQRTVVAVVLDDPDTPYTPYTTTDFGNPEVVFTQEQMESCTVRAMDANPDRFVVADIASDAIPDYEYRFQAAITELVMRHIDRMNDICEEDQAERIIASFVAGFDVLFQPYLNEKFPGRQAAIDASIERMKTAVTNSQEAVRHPRPPKRRSLKSE